MEFVEEGSYDRIWLVSANPNGPTTGSLARPEVFASVQLAFPFLVIVHKLCKCLQPSDGRSVVCTPHLILGCRRTDGRAPLSCITPSRRLSERELFR